MGKFVAPIEMTLERFWMCRAFAQWPLEQKLDLLKTLDDQEAAFFRYTWEAWARDKQLAEIEAPGDWWTHWVILAGRGFGKTRIGAEWIRMQAESNRVGRMILVARTAADVRDTMVEGESGIMSISPSWFRPEYQPSRRRIVWPNGATAITFSAEEPDSLRGPQSEKAWADERASWCDEAWDNLMFGMRLGANPQCVVTTTPRPTKAIIDLKKAKTSKVTIGSTYENRVNLAPSFIAQVVKKYEGTRLGRQELYAEIIDDAPGALWKRDPMIEALRVMSHPDLKRVVVGLDPPASDGEEENSEAGIIVAGLGIDDHGYVLADYSMRGSPNEWAKATLTAYSIFRADRIIGEVNNGGTMVEAVLRNAAKEENMYISYKAVRATRGKQLRAEPISSLYEQGRCHHVGTFSELEDQQCNWQPGMKSPDRLDALVWCFTHLMVGETFDDVPCLLYSPDLSGEMALGGW